MRNHAQQYAWNDGSSSNIKPLRHLDSLLILYSGGLYVVEMCLTSVSYTNRFYSCSECAAIEVDEWCQGNVSARLSERFHSWNVESQQKKGRRNFLSTTSRMKKKFRLINDRLNENLMRHRRKISIYMQSWANMIRSHDSIQLLNFPEKYWAPGIITVL